MNNDSIEKYLFLNNNKHLNLVSTITAIVILLIFIVISLTINIKTYETLPAKVVQLNNKYLLEIDVPINKSTYILNNNKLYIDKYEYCYNILKIDSNLYENNNNNYQIIYLNVELADVYKINNYLASIKILKNDMKIIDYIKNYFQ